MLTGKKYLHPHIHWGIIYNSQELGTNSANGSHVPSAEDSEQDPFWGFYNLWSKASAQMR